MSAHMMPPHRPHRPAPAGLPQLAPHHPCQRHMHSMPRVCLTARRLTAAQKTLMASIHIQRRELRLISYFTMHISIG